MYCKRRVCTIVLAETLQIIAEHLPIANMEPVDECHWPMVSSDALQCLTN